MHKKLTNEIIDQRLVARPIKRIGEYVNVNTNIKWQCLVGWCGNTWLASPNNILAGKGCPNRRHSKNSITNEIIDQRLINRNIKRIDNYVNPRTKSVWQCLKNDCNFLWTATSNSVIDQGTGCPKCAGNSPLSNAEIDKKLIGRNIKRLEDCIKSRAKIKWQCLIEKCKYVWETRVDIILDNHGCPKCSGKLKLTNEIIDTKLQDKNIKRLDDYINIKTKIRWQCLKETCGYIWLTKPDIILADHGCPRCSGCLKLTNEIIDERLATRPIQRLDNCIDSFTKIRWQCNICNHIWRTVPGNLKGCPVCKNKNEKLIYNLLKGLNIKFEHNYNIYKIKSCTNKRYRVDFYFLDYNIIIEYNGAQHYTPVRFGGTSLDNAIQNLVKQQIRDEYVRNFCKINNIILIEINGREFYGSNLEKFMKQTIIPQLV